MSVRLAVRITNCCAMMNTGADLEVVTHIIEIENDQLEKLLKAKQYETVSLSVVAGDAS